MVVDYDFRLGKNHLRGNGWRGLAALVIILALRATIIVAIVFSANPSSLLLVHLFQRLVSQP
jgi:hypothetical protein